MVEVVCPDCGEIYMVEEELVANLGQVKRRAGFPIVQCGDCAVRAEAWALGSKP